MLMPVQCLWKPVRLDMKCNPRTSRNPYRELKELGHPQGGLFPVIQQAVRSGRDEAAFRSFPND
jgi:hypothetical protein